MDAGGDVSAEGGSGGSSGPVAGTPSGPVSVAPRAPRMARDLRVDPLTKPGWISGGQRLPECGEEVHCAEGAAEVVRVLGKTGTGVRLLELKVHDGRRHPFFAAADNVRVAPTKD